MSRPIELMPGLYRFEDTCNVYVFACDDGSVAIDFGSGKWRTALPGLGLPPLKHVYLTHHHADQCEGLQRGGKRSFTVHAPHGERALISPAAVHKARHPRELTGVPASYKLLKRGLDGVRFDMNGFGDHFIGAKRIRFIDTPGHGPGAISVVIDHHGKQVVFCGDAAHAGATVHEPYQLEWDHWTGDGAVAAWQGIKRLADLRIDLLCPSHGPVIAEQPRAMLRRLAGKLLNFAEVKGNICPGESDRYLEPRMTRSGARQVCDNLYQFGNNGYLLVSQTGAGLVIDPFEPDLAQLDRLLAELDGVRVTDITATHYHVDHIDGAPTLKRRHGAKLHLHPRVAKPIARLGAYDVPWLPRRAIRPDNLLPVRGTWRWNEYRMRVAPFAGQTWWHCCLMTTIAGRKVFFGGDNFQPNSRWNGTGGFCAYNGCRFREGFARSAKLVLDWKPDVLACGHGTYYRFAASQFRKIIRWADKAERAAKALCPSGNLSRDYYLHPVERD